MGSGHVDVGAEHVNVVAGHVDVVAGYVDVVSGYVDVVTGCVGVIAEHVEVVPRDPIAHIASEREEIQQHLLADADLLAPNLASIAVAFWHLMSSIQADDDARASRSLAPGAVLSPFGLGRINSTAEAVAASISFLLSDDGVNVTVAILPFDGGQTAH